MTKEKRVAGTYMRVTNYDETGPGYLSAYGMVAAIHEEMRRGPTAPASSTTASGRTVRSITVAARALLTRLSSPVQPARDAPVQLRARATSTSRVTGPVAPVTGARSIRRARCSRCGFRRRGYYRELEPPIPVEVLEGRIKGTLAKPIAGYVPEARRQVRVACGRPAASETPEDKAGGDSP